jgi:hypothetical protein
MTKQDYEVVSEVAEIMIRAIRGHVHDAYSRRQLYKEVVRKLAACDHIVDRRVLDIDPAFDQVMKEQHPGMFRDV